MSGKKLSVAIVGAGIGGLTAAAALGQAGIDVQVYEQAPRIFAVGAGIQLMPNSMKVLRGIGVEEILRRETFASRSHLNRVGDTGEITNELFMPEERYGAPDLCMHRATLHRVLTSVASPESIHLGHKLVGLEPGSKGVDLSFANGVTAHADAVVGADGVHSVVREFILGPEQRPIFGGRVAYRAIIPASRLEGYDLGLSRTKWWGEDRHIVIYYTTAARDEVSVATSVPESAEWMTPESWSTDGDVADLCRAFEGFHAEVKKVVAACLDCNKWALRDREPYSHWCDGPITLLGDACHPMIPYMAQGASQAIEDAAILARCLAETEGEDIPAAFLKYEAHRKPRTSKVQAISRANTWLRTQGADTDWLYGYDAWNVPLEAGAGI
jgi:salicylate hydroxylase/6-hydroxynicotinate 3-monooxygenase